MLEHLKRVMCSSMMVEAAWNNLQYVVISTTVAASN